MSLRHNIVLFSFQFSDDFEVYIVFQKHVYMCRFGISETFEG